MLLIIWIILAFLVGTYADRKGKSALLYFFLSIFLTPIIGFVMASLSGENEEGLLEQGKKIKCSNCGELIRPEAKICRFCNSEIKNIIYETKVEEQDSENSILNSFKTGKNYIEIQNLESKMQELKGKISDLELKINSSMENLFKLNELFNNSLISKEELENEKSNRNNLIDKKNKLGEELDLLEEEYRKENLLNDLINLENILKKDIL